MAVNTFRGSLMSTLLGLALSAPAMAAQQAEPDRMTSQALKLYSLGRLQEAIGVESEDIEHDSKKWTPYAVRSFLLWKQGNPLGAIADAEKAADLAGDNTKVLTNLGIMYHTMAEWDRAKLVFETAHKQDPNNWLPVQGMARCFFSEGVKDKGIDVLKQMVDAEHKSFDWYQRAGELALAVDEPGLAEKATGKALRVATNRTEKAQAERQLCLALLRANKIEQAQAFKKEIIADQQLADPELIALTAQQLISASDPLAAKRLLQSTEHNLVAAKESGVFFSLGRIFESKGAALPAGNIKLADWLTLAEKSYGHAIAMSPEQSRYRTALATIYLQQSKPAKAIAELEKAAEIDNSERLLKALLANLKQQPEAKPLALKEVRFSFNGSSCGCKTSKIAGALRQVDGVLFASTKGNLGGMLIDPQVAPANEIFNKGTQLVASIFKKADVRFTLIEEKQVSNATDSLKIAQDMFEPPAAWFYHDVKAPEPVMPVEVADSTEEARPTIGNTGTTH